MKKLLALLLAISLLCSLTACGKSEDNTMPKKYQEIIDDHIDGQDETNYLLVGDEERPQATFHMEHSFLPVYKAYSSDENVVTVSPKGKVTAVGPGVAYIVVDNKLPIVGINNYECVKYTVYSLESLQQELPAESWIQLDMVVGDTDGDFKYNASLFCSDETVASFAPDGTLIAQAPGTVHVLRLWMDRCFTYEITVHASAYDMWLAQDRIQDQETALASFEPSEYNCINLTRGETHDLDDITFLMLFDPIYSTDTSVITVTEDGFVKAVGEGVAYVVVCLSNEHSQVFQYTVTKS